MSSVLNLKNNVDLSTKRNLLKTWSLALRARETLAFFSAYVTIYLQSKSNTIRTVRFLGVYHKRWIHNFHDLTSALLSRIKSILSSLQQHTGESRL